MIRRLDTLSPDIVTYDLGDGRRVCLDHLLVELVGVERALRPYVKAADLHARVPMYQDGVRVGWVPAIFDPDFARTGHPLYNVRPGDFVRTADGAGWEAAASLGPGDLAAVPGFVWDREEVAQ